MRKILLGTTAVAGFALLAPEFAAAQEAPTVRIGGYFRAYYGYTQQTSPHSQNVLLPQQAGGGATALNGTSGTPVGLPLSQNTPLAQDTTVAAGTGGTAFAGNVNNVNVVQGGGANVTQVNQAGLANLSTAQATSTRTGKHDFSTDAEIHVFVNGKTANGLSYGAVVEMQFDQNEGTFRNSRRTYNTKTMADIDEMYAFISSPTLGQIRFGDEDGPFGGLMNVGFVTNFGTGGIYGEWQDFVIRPNRTTTSPGDVGDNTKIIYLSPQFFGFDFGASWAFNEGSGGDTGCTVDFASSYCDRTYATTGVTGFGRGNDSLPGRRNEYQLMARWRGNIAGIGLAASFGYMGATAVRDMTASTGTVVQTLRDPSVFQAGLQATAYGFTVGANYMWGNTNFFYIPTVRGDQNMQQWFVGGSYTLGPVTVGANAFWGTYAGAAGSAFNTNTGALTRNANLSVRGQRRYGYGVGANYRLAPGLDIVAEYVRHVIHETGLDQDNQPNNGIQDKLRANVFILGTRLAF